MYAGCALGAQVALRRPGVEGASGLSRRGGVHHPPCPQAAALAPAEQTAQPAHRVRVAVLATRHAIQLHALCVLSNHLHDVASDRDGRIVEFRRDLDALLARAVNAMHGDFESVWAREPTCRVICVEPDDALDKVAYTMANPVAALLVEHGHSWPGVRCAWPKRPRTIKRPPGFFRDGDEGGTWPETATLELHRPPGYDHLSDEELADIRRAIEQREESARRAARVSGQRFLGRRQVLAQPRTAFPSSSETRFGLRPAVAARSMWARIEKLREDRVWLEHYEDAKARVRAGEAGVCFPFGTWKLRVYYRVACQGPPVSRFRLPDPSFIDKPSALRGTVCPPSFQPVQSSTARAGPTPREGHPACRTPHWPAVPLAKPVLPPTTLGRVSGVSANRRRTPRWPALSSCETRPSANNPRSGLFRSGLFSANNPRSGLFGSLRPPSSQRMQWSTARAGPTPREAPSACRTPHWPARSSCETCSSANNPRSALLPQQPSVGSLSSLSSGFCRPPTTLGRLSCPNNPRSGLSRVSLSGLSRPPTTLGRVSCLLPQQPRSGLPLLSPRVSETTFGRVLRRVLRGLEVLPGLAVFAQPSVGSFAHPSVGSLP
jgi:putative transposase